ncbi:MAG TPA: hypothetical protein PKY59_09215 [Pyrinomonadaceae bacterium]|nr:hypothetical protein [Pyrinomonadaceae bacterium]
MLEQELLNQEAEQPVISPQVSSGEPELFEFYEVKNWNFSPRLYKILAASAMLNIVGLLVFAQTNLLTRKGCESPLVNKVCDVIDTVYVGSVLLGKDKEFVDKDYTPSELGDAEIIYVDVSGQQPPLKYPDGYFALANPESVMPDVIDTSNPSGFEMPPTGSTPIPGITNNPIAGGTDLSTVKPNLPPPIKNPIAGGPLPTSPLGRNPIGPNAKIRTPKGKPFPQMKNDSPGKLPDLDDTAKNGKDKTEPKQPDLKSEPVTEVELNKRPLKDLGKYVNGLLADKTKKFDLTTQFMVAAKGKLMKDGRIDPKTFKYLQAQSNDPQMVEVVQQSIEAIDASGYLKYLADLSGRDLNLVLQQDDTNITAQVLSEVESDSRAKSIKNALDLAISLVKMKKTSNNSDQNDKDDLELLNGASVQIDGKKILIKFAIPKATAQQLIQRKLLEQTQDPAQPKQPNGTATTVKPNQTAGK